MVEVLVVQGKALTWVCFFPDGEVLSIGPMASCLSDSISFFSLILIVCTSYIIGSENV